MKLAAHEGEPTTVRQLEDELGLLFHHDDDERIEMVLDKTTWHGRTYCPLRELIDEVYAADAVAAGPLCQRPARRSPSRNQ